MNLRILIVGLALVAGSQISAKANLGYVLVIDESNPSDVTLTAATIGHTRTSSTDSSGVVDLSGFFTSSVSSASSTLGGSGLSIHQTSVPYVNWQTSGTTLILSPQVDPPESFVSGTQTFSGSATLSLLGDESYLPAAGTYGSITAASVDIGNWYVEEGVSVPEPSNVLLMGALTMLMSWVAYRRPSLVQS